MWHVFFAIGKKRPVTTDRFPAGTTHCSAWCGWSSPWRPAWRPARRRRRRRCWEPATAHGDLEIDGKSFWQQKTCQQNEEEKTYHKWCIKPVWEQVTICTSSIYKLAVHRKVEIMGRQVNEKTLAFLSSLIYGQQVGWTTKHSMRINAPRSTYGPKISDPKSLKNGWYSASFFWFSTRVILILESSTKKLRFKPNGVKTFKDLHQTLRLKFHQIFLFKHQTQLVPNNLSVLYCVVFCKRNEVDYQKFAKQTN